MKKITFTFGIILVLSSIVFAQTKENTQPRTIKAERKARIVKMNTLQESPQNSLNKASLNPQPLPPKEKRAVKSGRNPLNYSSLNPQPLPPKSSLNKSKTK